METPKLVIDKQFKELIPPLSAEEYQQLEMNILAEGCREPLCVWGNIIIDGHNRYEICQKHGIPFKIVHITLKNRDEAISWICNNQLGRRNISLETRKYLIGKRFEAEKHLGASNSQGFNQYKKNTTPEQSIRKTALRLGKDYHISHATVDKYGIYARAIDKIERVAPELAAQILSGKVKISHENIVEISKLPSTQMRRVGKSIVSEDDEFVKYSGARRGLQEGLTPLPTIAIKTMPVHDPDAEINSLALTIPSWMSSIERVISVVDFSTTSRKARKKLLNQLVLLRRAILKISKAIKE